MDFCGYLPIRSASAFRRNYGKMHSRKHGDKVLLPGELSTASIFSAQNATQRHALKAKKQKIEFMQAILKKETLNISNAAKPKDQSSKKTCKKS